MNYEKIDIIISYLTHNQNNLSNSTTELLENLYNKISVDSYISFVDNNLAVQNELDEIDDLDIDNITIFDVEIEEEKNYNSPKTIPILEDSFQEFFSDLIKMSDYPQNIPPLLSKESLQEKLITFPILQQKDPHSRVLEVINSKIKSYHDEHVLTANKLIHNNANESNLQWISLDEIEKLKEDLVSMGTPDKVAKINKYLNKIQTHKPVLQFDKFNEFVSLTNTCPNFKEVSQFYKGSFVLNNSKYIFDQSYNAPTPILLLGEPGIGKTYFAKKLAKILGTTFHFLDANSITASWVLTGASGQWQNADAGNIFKYILESNTISPVVILDEIDKLSQGKNYDPFSVFHQMFESENSSQFKDEFLNISFDASKIIYILTANNINNIPDSLLSRMRVFDIKRPSNEDMKIIAQNIYKDIIGNTPLLKSHLNNIVLDKLISLPPRDIKKQISNAVFSQLADSQDINQDLVVDIANIPKNWGF